jgi:hypothetical protein
MMRAVRAKRPKVGLGRLTCSSSAPTAKTI